MSGANPDPRLVLNLEQTVWNMGLVVLRSEQSSLEEAKKKLKVVGLKPLRDLIPMTVYALKYPVVYVRIAVIILMIHRNQKIKTFLIACVTIFQIHKEGEEKIADLAIRGR